MSERDIAFPNLHIYLKNVPRSISLFGKFDIMFYAIIIVIGMFLGRFVADRIARKAGESKDYIWDFFFPVVFFSVIGARIYYVIFRWSEYKSNPISVFYIRQGGLAIYGGVIAAFITGYVYCKIKKDKALKLLDYCVPGLILGQAIGRWGNFFNREVFGEYTDNIFAMRLPLAAVRARDITDDLWSHVSSADNFIQVHPTFLYESAWNFLVFALLMIFYKKKKFNGEVCLWYLAGYGLGRFFIERIRTDTLFIPGTTMPVSEALAAIMFVGSVLADIVIRMEIAKKPQIVKTDEVKADEAKTESEPTAEDK